MTDPEPPNRDTDADDYESKYMAGDGDVLLRDKMHVPWFFHLLFMLPVLIALGLPFVDPLAGFGPWFALPLFFVAWAIFSTLRVVVSEAQVHIQYGLFGPKIPVASITKAEAVDYKWTEYGGYGIRKGFDGTTAYNLIGDKGRGVRIHWRDDKGKVKKVLISSAHPEKVAAAIALARERSSHGASALEVAKAAQGVLPAPSAPGPATAEAAPAAVAVTTSADTERD